MRGPHRRGGLLRVGCKPTVTIPTHPFLRDLHAVEPTLQPACSIWTRPIYVRGSRGGIEGRRQTSAVSGISDTVPA